MLLAAKKAGRDRVLTTDDLPSLTPTDAGPGGADPGPGYTRGAGTNGATALLGSEIGSHDPR